MNIKKKFISLVLRLTKICPGLRGYLCRAWNLNTLSYWDRQYGNDKAQDKWSSQVRLQFYDLAATVLPKEPATVLDVGSGIGFGAKHLMEIYDGWDVHGLDFSAEACGKAVVKTHCVDLLKNPIPDEYEYLLVVETLEHFAEPMKVLKKIYDAAKKVVIITVPYKGQTSPTHPVSFDENSFTAYPDVDVKVHRRTQDDGTTRQDMLVVLKKSS